MSITYKIDKFIDLPDEGKKLVGLQCVNSNGQTFIVDKKITVVDGKSDASYVADAHTASADEINAWSAQFAVQGRAFNPETGNIE